MRPHIRDGSSEFIPGFLSADFTFLPGRKDLLHVLHDLPHCFILTVKASIQQKQNHLIRELLRREKLFQKRPVCAEPVRPLPALQIFDSVLYNLYFLLFLLQFLLCCLFLLALLFSPIFLTVPSFATAPALIVVGFMMMQQVVDINWHDVLEAIPCFITIIMMPFMYSISEGIAFGMSSYAILNTVAGQSKKVTPLVYILAVVFIFKYILI